MVYFQLSSTLISAPLWFRGFLSRKRPLLLLLLHQLLQAANRLIQFRLHNQRNLQFHLLEPMLIPWTCFLRFPPFFLLPSLTLPLPLSLTCAEFICRLCRMLLQMLLVVKISMFCEIIHSSEVCFPWCRLTLKFCRFFYVPLNLSILVFYSMSHLHWYKIIACSLCFKN